MFYPGRTREHWRNMDCRKVINISEKDADLCISRWLQENSEEVDDNDFEDLVIESGSEAEDERQPLQENLHESNTENFEHLQETSLYENFSSDDDVPLSRLASRNTYNSRNRTIWSKNCPPETRRLSDIPTVRLPKPRGAANEAKDPLSCFTLYFDDVIFDIIVTCTNKYIEKIKNKYERDRDARFTDLEEIKAFVGMLIMIGATRGGRRNLKDYWDNSLGTGLEAIYCTMSQNRFRFLLRCIRFDDVADRAQRRAQDRLAPIRQVIELFIQNCRKNYLPSEFLTLDEQLVGFRGRCGFIVYIPIKPDKFGIKIYMLADTKFPYVYNFEVYVGAQPAGPFQISNKVEDVVKRLVCPIYDYRCNVTMDNYFTSLPTSLELLKKNITVVGTMKSNRPEIPDEFKAQSSRAVYSSLFGFQREATLVSYVPKRKKAVILLSTKHHNGEIDHATEEKQKPEIVTFYNRTKCGVDIIDKMCKQYSVVRNSRRWPLTLFFNLINIGGINALVINQMNCYPEKLVRRDFLYKLSFELMKPLMKRRVTIDTIPRNIRTRISLLLNIPEDVQQTDNTAKTGRVGKCYMCSRARNKSTKKWCKACRRWTCVDHLVNVCLNCSNQ